MQQQLTVKQQELADLTRRTRQLFVELNMMSDERAARVVHSPASVAPEPQPVHGSLLSARDGVRSLPAASPRASIGPLSGPPKLAPKKHSSAGKPELTASATPAAAHAYTGTGTGTNTNTNNSATGSEPRLTAETLT